MQLTVLIVGLVAGLANGRPQTYKSQVIFGPHNLQASHAPNSVSMSRMMEIKMDQHAANMKAGLFQPGRYSLQPPSKCKHGKVGEYSCDNIDLKGHLRHQDMHSVTRTGNDIWGKIFISWWPFFCLFLSSQDQDWLGFGLDVVMLWCEGNVGLTLLLKLIFFLVEFL